MTLDIKQQLYTLCQQAADEKISQLQQLLKDLKDAGSDSTKSSMGDKYETTTAMLHLDQEKYGQRLNEALQLRSSLDKINPQIENTTVQAGSLVKTSMGNFFIAIFAGKLESEGQSYFAISLASPIGKAMEGAKAGESILFRDKKVNIIALI